MISEEEKQLSNLLFSKNENSSNLAIAMLVERKYNTQGIYMLVKEYIHDKLLSGLTFIALPICKPTSFLKESLIGESTDNYNLRFELIGKRAVVWSAGSYYDQVTLETFLETEEGTKSQIIYSNSKIFTKGIDSERAKEFDSEEISAISHRFMTSTFKMKERDILIFFKNKLSC